MQAKFTHLLPKAFRELVTLIYFRGYWCDDITGKTRHHIAKRIDIFAQIKSHPGLKHVRYSQAA